MKTPRERPDRTTSIWLRDEAPPSRPSSLTRERIVNEAEKLGMYRPDSVTYLGTDDTDEAVRATGPFSP